MSENGNFLNVELNENHPASRLSTGTDFLYVTADSDVLNITDDLCNRSFQQCENGNDLHPSEPNSNVVGVSDLSLSECFQKMKLNSDSSFTMGSERGSASSYPESTDMPSNNQSEEIPSVSQVFLSQEASRRSTLREVLRSSEENNLPQQETNILNISKETLPSSEENNLSQQESSILNLSKETLPSSGENLPRQETSILNISKETLPSSEENNLPQQETSILNISKETLPSSGENNLPQQETSILNISKETLPSSEENNLLFKGASSHDDSKESLTSPEGNSSPKQSLGVHLISEGTLPCPEIETTFLPQDSVKEVFTSPTLGQNVCSNTLEDGFPLPEEVRKPLSNFSSPRPLDIVTSPVASNNIAPEGEKENTSLNENKKDESLDTSESTLFGQTQSFQEVSVSSSSSVSKAALNPGNESDSLSFTENRDLFNLSNPPTTLAEGMDSCVAVPDLVPANGETKVNNAVNPDNHLFKVPALPDESNKAMQRLDASKRDTFGLPLRDADNISNFCLPINATRVDQCDNFSDCANGQGVAAFGNVPGILTEPQEGFLGIPDSVVFTDFKNMDNPGSGVDPFKVQDMPKEEDEEFADAVQFFKDPSSFNYLENIVTSAPPESVIPRSSLYLAFDPLHSKIVHGSQVQGVRLRRSEMGVANAEETSKNDSFPVNRNLVDVSARESMGNILISFDSPMAANKARDERIEESATSSVAPKHYSEEELQQALKIHELTIQEMYLKKQCDLEHELQKTKADSQATIKKITGLYNALRGTLEELLGVTKNLAEEKKQMQEKIADQEKEVEKLKEDLKTGDEDLQSVENTFSDFHKRYEQCKAMLKSYKDNEVHLKEEFTNLTTKLCEKEQEYNALQERTQELLEKASAEVASAKKSSDGQVTVLKAQLKKAELKISGLESDIQKIKIENSQLGGICDDLMDKVSKS